MKKRLLAILLCVVMCLGLLPGAALADETASLPGGRVKYYHAMENTFDEDYRYGMGFDVATNHDVVFFDQEDTCLSDYTVRPLDEGVVSVAMYTSDAGVKYASITGVSVGETDLIVAVKDVDTYRLHVVVDLPEWGFYTVDHIDVDKQLRRDVTYGTDKGQYTSIYLIRKGGIPAESKDGARIMINDQESAGEGAPSYLSQYGQWIETAENSGRYYLKVELPRPPEKEGSYWINIFVPGTQDICDGFGNSLNICLPGQSGGGQPGPGGEPGPGPGGNQGDHGFYVKPVYDEEYRITSYEFQPGETEATVYLMGSEALSGAPYVEVNRRSDRIRMDGRGIPDVEGAAYCYAFTLPGLDPGSGGNATAWASRDGEDPFWVADVYLSCWMDDMRGTWEVELSDGLTYGLELGQNWDGAMWPANTQSCRLPNETTSMEMSFLLWCRKENGEASEKAYTEFFDKYDLSVTCPENRQQGGVTVSITGAGRNTKVTITATGPWMAKVMLVATPKAGEETVSSFTLFRYNEPAYLTDDNGDGVYEIPEIEGWNTDWFAIDLGEEKRVEVSAQVTMSKNLLGGLSLAMADDRNETLWWKGDEPGGGVNIFRNTANVKARYLLLEFNCWAMTDLPDSSFTASAAITVTPAVASLMAVNCWMDQNGELHENEEYVKDIRSCPGGTSYYLFGHGYPDEMTSLTVTEVRSSHPNVIQAEVRTGKRGVSFVELSFLTVGTATLTVTAGDKEYTMKAASELPELGFYSKAERSAEAFLGNWSDYTQLTDGKLYFIGRDGLDLSEMEFRRDEDVLPGTAWAVEELDGYTCVCITPGEPEGGAGFEVSVWETRNDELMASIWIAPDSFGPGEEYSGSCYRFEYNGEDWVVGFTFDVGDTIIVNEGMWRYGDSVEVKKKPTAAREKFRDMTVAAGMRKQESQGSMAYYLPDDQGTVGLEVVKMWVEPLDETDEECCDCLSWVEDANAAVTEKTDGFTNGVSAPLYARPGYAADAKVWATVRISVPGQATVDANVSVIAWLYRTSYVYNDDRPDDDTLAELQQALDDTAEALDPDVSNQIFNFNLGKCTYEGTLRIPVKFSQGDIDLNINGYTGQDGGTTFIGGIDLQEEVRLGGLQNIHFKAPAEANNGTLTSAVFNGTLLNMDCCVLEGYDVALDASYSSMHFNRNVFVNNRIAVRVDLADHCMGGNLSASEENTFIKNGTAIQMRSFSPNFIPYFFRIVESNFIGNTLDFDMQSPNTTVYQYRNYYGVDVGSLISNNLNTFLHSFLSARTVNQINALVLRRLPQVNAVRGSTVVTNPRWRFPVNNWWHYNRLIGDVFPAPSAGTASLMAVGDEEYADMNALVADWDMSTVIINKEAKGLILDASAFDEEGANKVIDVVDDEGNALGSWTFPDAPAQAAELMGLSLMEVGNGGSAASAGFNAGLTLETDRDGSIQVTVADNDVLSSRTPTLTIVGGSGWANASVTGPDGEEIESVWNSRTKEVTFVVAEGGTYLVAQAEAEERPGQPSDPGTTPPAPSTPSTPGTPSTTTETTTNEDGSVTTTVTDQKTGTVTETTVKETEDGVKTETVVVTDKEGNVTETETVTEPDGTVIETVTDPEGDKTLTVTDAEGERAVAIELPARLPELAEEEKFTDVPEDHWAAEAIENMAALGLVKGTSIEEKTYDMAGVMTRGGLASILFRFSHGAEGLESSFADVGKDDWYADGVAWAARNGIVTGYSADAFGPEDTVTRQQLAVMLCRFARLIGLDVSADPNGLKDFADVGAASDWAAEGVAWCVKTGILRGKGGSVLDPTAAVTRAEAAVMLDRLIGLLSA